MRPYFFSGWNEWLVSRVRAHPWKLTNIAELLVASETHRRTRTRTIDPTWEKHHERYMLWTDYRLVFQHMPHIKLHFLERIFAHIFSCWSIIWKCPYINWCDNCNNYIFQQLTISYYIYDRLTWDLHDTQLTEKTLTH